MKTNHEKKVYLAVDAHAGHCVIWLAARRKLPPTGCGLHRHFLHGVAYPLWPLESISHPDCVMGVMRKDGEWLGEERFLTSAKEPNISCVKMARGQYA